MAGFRTSEQTPFDIEMRFTMNKLLSCHYNMDTNRVETRFEDGTTLASTASLWRTNTATPRHSGQSWTGCCIISPWSIPSLFWAKRLSIIFPSAATMADWKINIIDMKKQPPTTQNRAIGGCFIFDQALATPVSRAAFATAAATASATRGSNAPGMMFSSLRSASVMRSAMA